MKNRTINNALSQNLNLQQTNNTNEQENKQMIILHYTISEEQQIVKA